MSLLPRRPPLCPFPGPLPAAAAAAATTLAAATLADRFSIEGPIAEVPASARSQRLDGRTALVTGANTGLGLETAVNLARAGADVVIACRDAQKGARAVAQVEARAPGGGRVETAALDLASLASVRAFAEDWRAARGAPPAVLVNNAGLMRLPFTSTDRRLTADGFEEMAGVNHLGHFLLTTLLLEGRDGASPPCRVVSVASVAHAQGEVDLFDFNLVAPGRYTAGRAYAQSKLANILFTAELQKRYGDVGVEAVCCHPGIVRSELFARDVRLASALAPLALPFTKSPAQGAATQTYLALAPARELELGGYYAECQPAQPTGSQGVARDAETARKLWELSQSLIAGAESRRAAFGGDEARPAFANDAQRGGSRIGVTYV